MSGPRITVKPKNFRVEVGAKVPKRLEALHRKVFLAAAARVHKELTLGTQVDTGYMRASIAASVGNAPFPPLPPLKQGPKKPGMYRSLWGGADARSVGALASAVRDLRKITFAYGASYAKYTHAPELVKRVRRMMPVIMRDAKRDAERQAGNA